MRVQGQFADVNLDVGWYRVGRTFDFEGVDHDVHDAARVPHAVGDADRHDRQRSADGLALADALQVRVNDAARNRIALHLAHERGIFLRTVDRDAQQAVLSARVQQIVES